MENRKTREFSEAAKVPAAISVVLEAWWKAASTPGDLVDVLVAAAGADLLTGDFRSRHTSSNRRSA